MATVPPGAPGRYEYGYDSTQQGPPAPSGPPAGAVAPYSNAPDPLLEALRRYITSGPSPSHVLESDIQDIYSKAAQQPAGRAALEAFISDTQTPPPQIWSSLEYANGSMDCTPILCTFSFVVQGGEVRADNLHVQGLVKGIFRPGHFVFKRSPFWYSGPLDREIKCRLALKGSQKAFQIFFFKDDWMSSLAVLEDSNILPSFFDSPEGTAKPERCSI